MAIITGVTEVQDSTGATVVVPNVDGTRPPLVFKAGAGITFSYAKSGNQGIITATSSLAPGTDVTAGTVTADQVTIGPGTWTFADPVTTTDDVPRSLLATALPVPASGSLQLAALIKGTIVSAGLTLVYVQMLIAVYVRNGTAAPYRFLNASQYDAFGQPPYGDNGRASDTDLAASVVTGAVSAAGAISLVTDATVVNGSTVTVANVGGVPNATGVWPVAGSDGSSFTLTGSTFAGAYTSGGTVRVHGCAGPILIANSVQLQAVGVKPPLWLQSKAITIGAFRYAAGSGNTYVATSNGTTAGSGAGPTGTGSGITDGTVTWAYHGSGQAVTVVWQVQDLRSWAS